MNFSVNVDALYWGKNFYEAVEQLGEAGINNIEFWSWWDKDLNRMLELKEKYNLEYTGFVACLDSMTNEKDKRIFLTHFTEAVDVAKKLGCKALFVKPGDKTQESFEIQYNRVVNILREIVEIAAADDIMVLLEPVSFLEAPDTFLGESELGFRLVEEINDPHLKLLYDVYHMQLNEGDVVRRVINNIDAIGHVHAAGIANRHELWDGEIDYGYVFHALKQAGYNKRIGLEYFPTTNVLDELKKVIFDHQYR